MVKFVAFPSYIKLSLGIVRLIFYFFLGSDSCKCGCKDSRITTATEILLCYYQCYLQEVL